MKFLTMFSLILGLCTLNVSAKSMKKRRASRGSYGPAGCGLGAMVFKGKKGMMYNVLAATTNGISGNQTFGITSGTLGCKSSSRVAALEFIKNNKSILANDIARGEGETLSAFLQIMDANESDSQILRRNYSEIFAKSNSSEEILSQVETVL